VLQDSERSSMGCPKVFATDATTNMAPRSGRLNLSSASETSGLDTIFRRRFALGVDFEAKGDLA